MDELFEECYGCKLLEPDSDISKDTIEIKVNSLLLKELEKANLTIKTLNGIIKAKDESYRQLTSKYTYECNCNDALRMRIAALQDELSRCLYGK